jgi:hypothetical protein
VRLDEAMTIRSIEEANETRSRLDEVSTQDEPGGQVCRPVVDGSKLASRRRG